MTSNCLAWLELFAVAQTLGASVHSAASIQRSNNEYCIWLAIFQCLVVSLSSITAKEVLDKSLDDIKFNFMPMYTDEEVTC